MTDQTIPDVSPEDVEAVHAWASKVLRRPAEYLPVEQAAALALSKVFPAKARPTLAEMGPEERAASP